MERINFKKDLRNSAELSSSSLNNNSSSECESTHLERFENIFTVFMSNLKKVKNNNFNKDTIECLYPSRQVQKYLNIKNNFRQEYMILFTDSMIILMENILNGNSRIESSVDAILEEVKEFFVENTKSYFQNESVNSDSRHCIMLEIN